MQYMKKVLFWFGISFLFIGCMGPDRSGELVVIDAGHGGHDSGAYRGGKKRKILYCKLQKDCIKR